MSIVHIPATHDKAYMVSLPRDGEVDLPDFPPVPFQGLAHEDQRRLCVHETEEQQVGLK
jgi:hypothetical protein